jgi:uncharacterized NAD(P)/FAD-binding protein YdhS
MKKIAIVGAGPTGIYTFFSLLKAAEALSITVYEQADKAGVGMPYSHDDNSRMMLANIASIEIPPLAMTYLDWLRQQSDKHLARYDVERHTLHDRQFLPRLLLGEYLRERFLACVKQAKKQGFDVELKESCQVIDLQATDDGVILWASDDPQPRAYDFVAIATGHVWPDENESTREFFPSPWSGLMEAAIPACSVGIMGTSLSGLDAAMAVVIQHGSFIEADEQSCRFEPDAGREALKITLMSRTGVFPEADFYCPLPYEPLKIVTESALEREVARGSDGLLDRIFALMVKELAHADPAWSERIALETLDADSFADRWFASRRENDPFEWAKANLREVERNKRDKHTVPWRYAILRLHEQVQEIVPHLTEQDKKRFKTGLARVFIDNYAAIPSQSIRRLLALHEAGIIDIVALGTEYKLDVQAESTVITADDRRYEFDVYIVARGQQALKTKDLPFQRLREQLLAVGDDIPDVTENYTLRDPAEARGRIAFGALPWLMQDRPFVQGLTASAEIGEAMAQAIIAPSERIRRRLW